MTEPKNRLQAAIADYDGPVDAWLKNQRALKEGGVGKDLLISNANGHRPISRHAATTYAKVFGHTAGWYLYGEGPQQTDKKDPAVETEAQLRAALIAFGVDRKSLARAIAMIRAGFVKVAASPERTPADGQYSHANRRREVEPSR